jgi:hypothetical protein
LIARIRAHPRVLVVPGGVVRNDAAGVDDVALEARAVLIAALAVAAAVQYQMLEGV